MYLIIGGTKFLGRHLVDSVLARGEKVVLFNRGKHPADNMPDVEMVHGDRNHDLDKLKGRKWKAVIDTCGYLPRTVSASAQALADSAERYIFISSMSAYADAGRPDFDETTALAELDAGQQERASAVDPSGNITAGSLGDLYGGLKAQCEQVAEHEMPGRVLTIRPGMIVGPYDPTDRFTYWVDRVAGGGEVLAPGDPGRFVQLIDARDLADWTIETAARGETGVYNATARPFEMTMAGMLVQIRETTGIDAVFSWACEEFLTRENVQPWSEMPFYLPESDEDNRGFLSANVDKALAAGLDFRPFSETVRDTLEWRTSVPEKMRAGITREREQELLGKLHCEPK
jgi:2'-hydroxyisoflavone reductase